VARGVRGGIFTTVTPDTDEDRVEDTGELGISAADEKAKRGDPRPEVHQQVAGLLGRPGAGRAGGHAEDVHTPGGDFHDEQHVQARQGNRVDMAEVDGRQALRLGA
jgi:hypothetical protein